MQIKDTFVIIPALNEEKTLPAVINDLKAHGFTKIIVINDGSTDQTATAARQCGATLLSHLVNRGLGGALGTGLAYAKQKQAVAVLTFDADGQHQAADALKVVQPVLAKKADAVIGVRSKKLGQMPLIRILGNHFLNIITYIWFGFWTNDSQSGLRAFSQKALNEMGIRSNRMEVACEVFGEIRRYQLRYQEVPIETVYTEYSLHKGQDRLGHLNFFRILWRLILLRLS